jgi:hypothetical protein
MSFFIFIFVRSRQVDVSWVPMRQKDPSKINKIKLSLELFLRALSHKEPGVVVFASAHDSSPVHEPLNMQANNDEPRQMQPIEVRTQSPNEPQTQMESCQNHHMQNTRNPLVSNSHPKSHPKTTVAGKIIVVRFHDAILAVALDISRISTRIEWPR